MMKIFRISVVLVLALIFALLTPMQILASDKKAYVSEIVIETGKTAEEAKKKLTDKGYTVYDVNVSNSENDNDDGTYSYMYIGYKTTMNPDEAITDIRLMHMGGGYSYAEYEEILNQKKEEVSEMVSRLLIAVKEFRANYNQGKKAAITAYAMLNQLIEDDSGLTLGDYLLDKSKTDNDYTKLLMQSSAVVLITIENALAIACSSTFEGNIYNLSNLDPEDFVGETQYEAIATDIFNDLPSVQKALEEYLNSGVTTKDGATEEEVNAVFDGLTDDESLSWTDSFAFAHMLETVELFDGRTLFDLFTTDLDELTTEDLYPLASLLSEGQAAVLNVAGVKNVITAALAADEKWEEIDEYSYKVEEPISVYTGVDRSLFEGGVALTNKAMVEAAANTEKGWFGGMSAEAEEIFYKIIGISYFTFFGALAVSCITRKIFVHVVLTQGSKISGMVTISLFGQSTITPAAQAALARYILTLKVLRYVYMAFTYISFIALGVMLIAATIYLVALGISYYYPDYDEVPKILVEKNTVNDETEYTYYYGIKNLDGNVVDMNQHDGNRWSALYTTKDKSAGNPIIEDFVITEESTKAGYVGVRKFSQDAAFDLNLFSYNRGFKVERDGGEVEIKSSYMYFKQSTETRQSKYASVFTGENITIAVCALGLGLVIGIVGTAIAYRKKK